jgi:hypothetical protein
VWTLIRSSSASRLAIGITAERRSRSSRPPSSAISRIVSSASTGVSCHPSLDPIAGTTNTPIGRSTLPTAPSRSPASESQVSDPIRQQRRSPASNWLGLASSHRDRSSAR